MHPDRLYTLNSTPSFNPKPIGFSQNFCYNTVTFPPTFRGGVRGGIAASARLKGESKNRELASKRWMLNESFAFVAA